MKRVVGLLAIFAQVLADWDDREGRPAKPNVILFLADDLGYGDLSMYGNPSIQTPNLRRLAAEGLQFFQAYSDSSVCSPSRAALITGRHAKRSGVYPKPNPPDNTYNTFFPFTKNGMPANETTIPELLKPEGYRAGFIGKWHLGNKNGALPTEDAGFDSFWGVPYSHDMGGMKDLVTGPTNPCPSCNYWLSFLGNPGVPLYRNTTVIQKPVDADTFNHDMEVETLRFMRDSNRIRKPFFLLVSHLMPHVPLVVDPEFRGTQLRGLYGDAVAQMDDLVGKIIDETLELRIDKKTLFIFTSDNGPWASQNLFGGSSGPFRGAKGTGWEGGFRMPLIVYQPDRVLPGVTQALVSHLDWLPTFAELAGAQLPSNRIIDGKSLVPLFKWTRRTPPAYNDQYVIRDSIAYHINGIIYAYRLRSFKAHFITIAVEGAPTVTENLLFNVAEDIAEKFPLDLAQPANQQIFNEILAAKVALEATYATYGVDSHPPLLGEWEFPLAAPCCQNTTQCNC